MNYYAVLLHMVDPEKSATHRPAHLDFLAKYRAERKIFANGRFLDGAGGLVIYMGETEEDVLALVAQDPYIIHGARRFEIHPWEMVTEAVLP